MLLIVRETEDDLKKWKDIPYSQIGRINIKMALLPNTNYRFNAIPVKLPMTFFTKLEQIILKFIQNHERPRIAKAILRKNNKVGGTHPDFHNTPKLQQSKPCGIVTKTDRDQWNRTENPHTYDQLIFIK